MSAQLASLYPASASVFVAVRRALLRAGLWSLLEAEPGVEPLASTADVGDLLQRLGRDAPDVVIIDEFVLGDAADGRLEMLVTSPPQTAFIVVGMHDDPAFLTRARDAGAADYVRLDEADRLGRAVNQAAVAARLGTACGMARVGGRGAERWLAQLSTSSTSPCSRA
jgi:DNA-binding NarL/FixJ family response regulator